MKTFRKIGVALMAVFACVCMASCGGDGPGAGSSAQSGVTLDGKKLDVPYVFWYTEGDGSMHVEFYNFNYAKPSSYPGKVTAFSIDYDVPAGTTTLEPITLSSNEYSMYLVLNGTASDEGWQGETKWRDSSNGDCVITKNGSKYSIKIDHATIYDIYYQADAKSISINYNGAVNKMPEEYWDE